MNRFLILHKFVLFGLVCVFFLTSPLVVFSQQKLTGELTVTGGTGGDSDPVTINGEGALSGRTVVSPLEIATPDKASASIVINGVGRLEFAPNTRMNLTFADGKIAGFFIHGSVTIVTSQKTAFTIETIDGVITAPNPELVNIINIYFEEKETRVKPITGFAAFNGKLISVGQIGGAGAQLATATASPAAGGSSIFTTVLPVVSAAAGVVGVTSAVADKLGNSDEEVSPVR